MNAVDVLAVPKHMRVRDGSVRIHEGLAFDAGGQSWIVCAKEFNTWLCKRSDRAIFSWFKPAQIKEGYLAALARITGEGA